MLALFWLENEEKRIIASVDSSIGTKGASVPDSTNSWLDDWISSTDSVPTSKSKALENYKSFKERIKRPHHKIAERIEYGVMSKKKNNLLDRTNLGLDDEAREFGLAEYKSDDEVAKRGFPNSDDDSDGENEFQKELAIPSM